MNDIQQRLSALRSQMKKQHIAAFITTGSDPHGSEYFADHWKEMEWISGFTGEAGTALILHDEAFIWTDSRYYLQANMQLADTGFSLMRDGELTTPSIPQYITNHLHKGDVVAINAELFSNNAFVGIQNILSEYGIKLQSADLIGPLWTEGRAAVPTGALYAYDEKYAGQNTADKLNLVRSKMAEMHADILVTSALDEIAWMLNIRGTDVEFNPVVVSYVILSQHECTLFIAPEKLTPEALQYLVHNKIAVGDYNHIYAALRLISPDQSVLFDGSKLNRALFEAIPQGCKKIDRQTPITLLKAQKNDVEIAGERAAMIKDGVALTRFFMWVEQAVKVAELTEYDLGLKLKGFRAEQENFVEESFGSIVGYQGNGAIVHYSAPQQGSAIVKPDGMLLVDSGGQYLEGTTDITRTICLGRPTEQMIHDYTLVLKGHLALARARFPHGTRGSQLDVLAHQYLWQEGLSYGHGTGHGVGHFLCCHEGPQNIRMNENPAILETGMIVSDEPGLYRTGKWGIRIENLITVVPAEETEFGNFLKFETITLFPYERQLIDTSMLDNNEIAWINNYQQQVYDSIAPHLKPDEQEWLKKKCAKL